MYCTQVGGEVGSVLPPCGSRDQTQAVRLVHKCLYPLTTTLTFKLAGSLVYTFSVFLKLLLSYSTSRPLPLPDPLLILFLQRRVGLPRISTEHSETHYYRTRHKVNQGWEKPPSRRKRVPRESDTPPLLGVPQKHEANNHTVFADDIVQAHAVFGPP